MEDDEIEEFFRCSFENEGFAFKNDKSIESMVYYSRGMPLVMQQIADSVFWNAWENSIIDEKTVNEGIVDAASQLGKKQLKAKLNRIGSQQYTDILIKLAKTEIMQFNES